MLNDTNRNHNILPIYYSYVHIQFYVALKHSIVINIVCLKICAYILAHINFKSWNLALSPLVGADCLALLRLEEF